MIVEGNCKICDKPFRRIIQKERKGSYYCSYKCYWIDKPIKNPGYQALHVWLRKYFGNADKCENPNCSKQYKTFHWALIKGMKYERKRENFWMLCSSCHTKYDKKENTNQKIGIFHLGNKWSVGRIPWNKGKTKLDFPQMANSGRKKVR